MFQKLPLIIRKYNKGLQEDKRSKTIINLTLINLAYEDKVFALRPTGKNKRAIGTAKAEAIGYRIVKLRHITRLICHIV